MDTLSAFSMGMANRGNRLKVFDWVKAAQLIKERQPSLAGAGLSGDWEWTGGEIFRDGKPIAKEETYTYLASTWATPELEMDGYVVDCWCYTDEWDSGTYWPEEALAIIAGKGERK